MALVLKSGLRLSDFRESFTTIRFTMEAKFHSKQMSALAVLWKYNCKNSLRNSIFPKGNIANTEIPLEELILQKIISNCPRSNHMTSCGSEEKLNHVQGTEGTKYLIEMYFQKCLLV